MELFECELPYFKTLRVTWTRGAVSFFSFQGATLPHCPHIHREPDLRVSHLAPE